MPERFQRLADCKSAIRQVGNLRYKPGGRRLWSLNACEPKASAEYSPQMVLQPATVDELCRALAEANARGDKVTGYDLRALDRVVDYTPEDLTVTAQAGLTLDRLQRRLAERGQWLPIDPPHADRLSLGALLATNASGPRRHAYGAIREHLIGIRVALADGRLIKAGGKVVKNVAGYDLCKLFVGSFGSLGAIVEATFKVLPLPEAEQFVRMDCESLDRAGLLLDQMAASDLTPSVLDLHNLAGNGSTRFTVVAGFAGTRQEVVWQLAQARELGLRHAAGLDHEARFWADGSAVTPRKLSVLPAELTEALARLGPVPFVARAGLGVVYYRGGPAPPKPKLPGKLLQRVKDTYDPKHILPDPPW